eukprot:3395031-Amphidinium_carterae.1
MESFEGAVEAHRRAHDFSKEFIKQKLLEQEPTPESKTEANLARLFIPACWGYRADLESSWRLAVQRLAALDAFELLTKASAEATLWLRSLPNFADYKGKLYKATVLPHEVMVTPCGMVTIEFSGNSDVFGHKVGCFYKGKHSVQDVQALLKEGTGNEEMLQYSFKVLRGLSTDDVEKLGSSPASTRELLISEPVAAEPPDGVLALNTQREEDSLGKEVAGRDLGHLQDVSKKRSFVVKRVALKELVEKEQAEQLVKAAAEKTLEEEKKVAEIAAEEERLALEEQMLAAAKAEEEEEKIEAERKRLREEKEKVKDSASLKAQIVSLSMVREREREKASDSERAGEERLSESQCLRDRSRKRDGEGGGRWRERESLRERIEEKEGNEQQEKSLEGKTADTSSAVHAADESDEKTDEDTSGVTSLSELSNSEANLEKAAVDQPAEETRLRDSDREEASEEKRRQILE